MATALFISRTDLVKNTISQTVALILTSSFNSSRSHKKYIYKNYLGSKLYDKISSDIINNDLSGDYLKLVNDYIQPMLIHFAMVEYLPFAAYQIKNGGVFKHSSENAETVNKSEVDLLIQKERDFSEYYTRRFVDYICFESNKFPEYNTNVDSDIRPDKDVDYTNWVL